MKLGELANLPVKLLLRSRWGSALFPNTALLTIRGRKTERVYQVPVNSVRVNGDLAVMSRLNRTWWRNLVGGAPLRLRVAGREAAGFGEAWEDRAAVARGLGRYLESLPQYARYFGVRLDEKGHPLKEDLERSAEDRVFVSIRLEG